LTGVQLKKTLVYLARPYSAGKASKQTKQWRFETVCQAAAQLMYQGYCVFSPIAHSHSVEIHGMDGPESMDFWLEQDFAVLKFCNKMVILTLPGWKDSNGIAKEIEFCNDNGIPIEYLDHDDEASHAA